MYTARGIEQLLERYYGDIAGKKTWDSLLAEDFLLSGTVVKETRGRQAYVDNPFFKLVREARVKEMLAQGDRAFAIVSYDLLSPKGRAMTCDVAEFWKAEAGRLCSIAIYFDTAAFNKFME